MNHNMEQHEALHASGRIGGVYDPSFYWDREI